MWRNWNQETEIRYYGLQNQGATCYLNSVLQVLFMTKEFRKTLLSSKSDEKGIDQELKELFEKLGVGATDTLDLSKKLGITSAYIQGDAAEYFANMLSSVRCKEASRIFAGKLVHKSVCCGCLNETSTSRAFWLLPLEPACNDYETFSVLAGIEMYFSETCVTGADQIYCEGCCVKVDAAVRLELERHPKVMTLLVKRFHFNYRYMEFVKNKCPVVFPYRVIIKGQRYKLYAFVEHLGELKRGHYTVTIKSPDDGKWYFFNDAKVSMLPHQPFQGHNDHRSLDAYLLFYRREGDPRRAPENVESWRLDVNGLGMGQEVNGQMPAAVYSEGLMEARVGPVGGEAAAPDENPAAGATTLWTEYDLIRASGFPPEQIETGGRRQEAEDRESRIQDGRHEARRVVVTADNAAEDALTRSSWRQPPNKSEEAKGNQRRDRGAKTRGGQQRGQKSGGRGNRGGSQPNGRQKGPRAEASSGDVPAGRSEKTGGDRQPINLKRPFSESNEPIADQSAGPSYHVTTGGDRASQPVEPGPPSGGRADFLSESLSNMTLRDSDWMERRGGGGPMRATGSLWGASGGQQGNAAYAEPTQRVEGVVQQTPWDTGAALPPDQCPPEAALQQPQAFGVFCDPLYLNQCYQDNPHLSPHPLMFVNCPPVYYPPADFSVEQATTAFQPMPPTGTAHLPQDDLALQDWCPPQAAQGPVRTRGPSYRLPTRYNYGERGTGL